MRSTSEKADSIDPSTSLPVQDSHDPTTVTESAEPIDSSTETTATNEQGLGSTESPSDSDVDPLVIVNSENIKSDGSSDSGSDTATAANNVKDTKRKSRNKPPEAMEEAEGLPHSIIEKPGQNGQYTTHNGDGTWKQYRGSGQEHGDIPRPNVKEAGWNFTPDGQGFIDKGRVRPPFPEEIPEG